MRTAGLLAVFLTAKILTLAGRSLPASPWTPLAFLWQDLAAALLFGVLEAAAPGPPRAPWAQRALWGLYGALAIWAAVNVPVIRVLSSPITPPMLRAARGTLADSISHHVTAANVGLAALALLPGILVPLALARAGKKPICAIALAAAPCILLGPMAVRRVDTGGLHRNAAFALAEGALPRIAPGGRPGDFRRSPFPRPEEKGAAREDLARLRGSARGKSVLLVVLESAGAGYLAPWGAAEDPMPNLTALARRSLLFESAYTVYPESIKGLFAVLTAVHPAFDAPPEAHARAAPSSLADALAAAGYRTALFHSGRFAYLGMAALVKDRGFETLEDAGDIGGERRSSFGVDEPAAVQRVLAWIDGLRPGDRFLAAYLPIAGHHPYDVPEPGPFPGQEEIGRYRNALHWADRALGDLLEGLQRRGLEREVLVAVFGDHGEAFHQHQGNYGHTFAIWEENVRVPLLFAVPGATDTGVRAPGPASLVDVAPTVLDLLGLAPPTGRDGASLLDPSPRMALFFTDYSLGLLGLRDADWKCIHELETGRTRLFDLKADPAERTDQAALLGERAAAYREVLLGWSSAARERILGAGRPARAAPKS